ncbi:transcription-repair coupling factor, partial [Campylobacter jejuni]|nr:transcription-repair coupling factor [Campylobacter jejuni]
MQASFYEYLQNPKICELFLCKDEKQADLLAQVSRFKGLKTFVLPDFRAQFGDDLRAFSKELFDLCKILNAYHKEEEKKILISPLNTVLKKLPSKKHLQNYHIDKKQNFDLKCFEDEISRLGYEFVDIVQDKGEISIRADIIDIFCINEENPIRILLFGEEIESIRYFDLQSQKSIPNELEHFEICPFLKYFDKENYEIFKDKLEDFQSDTLIHDINSLGFWCIDDFFDYLELDFLACEKFDINEYEKDISFVNAKILPQAKKFKELQSSYNKDF